MSYKNQITKYLCLLITLTLLLNLTGCKKQVQAENLMENISAKKPEVHSLDDSFSSAQMSFAVELFQHTAQEDEDKNILVSPLSVMLALAMTANGADEDTLSEMQQVLSGNLGTISLDALNQSLQAYVNSLPSGDKCKLQLANSIWFRDDKSLSIEEAFLQTNADYYNAQIYKSAFDSQTVKDINLWVNENTDKMIDKIIDRIDADTIMYLINALTFDAEWAQTYEKNNIRDGEFTSISGDIQTVDMMRSSEHYYLEDENATGFIKNYKDGAYRFVALLPNKGIHISHYIRSLTYDNLGQMIKNTEETTVIATMPKFSYEYAITMNDVLEEMGMPTAFDDDNANFTKLGVSDLGNIYIGNVLHKTFISVDELGTKAGAVTSVAMDGKSASMELPEPKIVRLDRPFVYMILDRETNLPIFIGTVVDLEK